MSIFKIKPNDNLFAIFTYIREDEYRLNMDELVQFCIDYDYYKELYEHFHIIKQLVEEHNKNHLAVRPGRIQTREIDLEDTIEIKDNDLL